MADLVFELGCEELPATAVRRACEQLQTGVEERLREAGLEFASSRTMGTPRRLILGIEGLPERQADSEKRQRGPALKSAYDAAGQPTGALLGFCKGQGIDVADLEKEGDYVWVTKKIAGRATSELLAEIIPSSVRALTFDKTMRWGSARMRFSRPLRWMLAGLGGALVSFEIEGVVTGLESRGHRFRAPENFEASSWNELMVGLRARFVEPDPAVREEKIRKQAIAVSGGKAQLSDVLIDENVFLTEWPECLMGDFPEAYLELPRAVLVTAMAKHEKMFPVQNEAGELVNQFVWVRNSGEEATVRAGNQWVLNARFNDAKFFYDEDARLKLDDFLTKTEQMTFQEKLGSVRQRADRLAKLTAYIMGALGGTSEEVEWARVAGLYAKADLSSGLVGELASLQGIVGGDYARREGMPEPVCHAIATQYDLGKNPAFDTPGAKIALSLLMADQIDKLVGFVGIGQLPSGSSDPFGLRRAATILIEVSWLLPRPVDFSLFIREARSFYLDQEISLREEVEDDIDDIFCSRLEAMLSPRRYDAIEGALASASSLNPRIIRARTDALTILAADASLISTLSRPINILAAAEKKGIETDSDYDASKLTTGSERALIEAVAAAGRRLEEADVAEDPAQLAAIITDMGPAINAFFETTMVMAEDVAVRDARLGLLTQIEDLVERVGDVTKLVPDSQP
jgi:glycyl-tRNA synthetase beta chain